MDLFEILFLLFFLVLPVLSRLFGAKKEAPPPTRRRPDHPDASGPERIDPGQASREETDLDDALRQIREALGQPAAPPPAPPPPQAPPRLEPRPVERPRPEPSRLEPRPVTRPRPEPPRRTPPPPRTTTPPRPRPVQAPTPMQQAAASRLTPRRERPSPPPAEVNLDAPLVVEQLEAGEQARRMAAQFRTPEGARNALLIKEVLGPPVSRRGRRR